MHLNSVLASALFSVSAAAAATAASNPWPKELVAVRRRTGLTHKEYLNYHALVHGAKCWNAPRDNSFPAVYVQDWVFDAAFGANDSVPDASYVGRDDVTELYGSSATTFLAPPPTDYIQTVIGPDGYNFADLASSFSMIAYETFPLTIAKPTVPIDTLNGPVTAFLWAASTNPTIDNTTFTTALATSLVKLLPANTIYNASINVPVPGTDARPYYGGYANPTINGVVKLWLTNTDTAVTSVRAAQAQLNNAALSLNPDVTFVLFTRQHTIYDTTAKNIPFSIPRLETELALTTIY